MAYMVYRIICIMLTVVGLVRQAGMTINGSENYSHSGQAGQQSAVCG